MKNLVSKTLSVLMLITAVSGVSQAAPESNGPRALLAYLNIQPGAKQPFLEAAKDVILKSRQEPGVIIYNFHQSLENPSQFVIYELFKSEADLQFHRNSPHVVGFLKTVNPMLVPNGFRLVEYR